MKKKIINGLLLLAISFVGMSSLVSCKDTVSDDNAVLREKLADEAALREALNNTVTELQAKVDEIKSCDCDLPTELQPLWDKINQLVGNLQTTDGNVQSLQDWKTQVAPQLSDLLTTVPQLQTTLGQIQDAVAQLSNPDLSGYAKQEDLTTLNNLFTQFQTDVNIIHDTFNQKFGVLNDSVAALSARSIADSIRLDAIERQLPDFATKQELKDSASLLRQEIAEAQAAAKQYTDEAVQKLMTDYITPLQDSVNIHSVKIKDLQDAQEQMQRDIQQLKDDVRDLADKQEKLQKQVDKLAEKVEENSQNISKIFNAMSKQVTGIIVQGVYSPVFGMGLLPVDMKTNIASAYYGYTTGTLDFPAETDANFVNKDQFSAADWANVDLDAVEGTITGIPAKTRLISDAENNAGKLYVTVNPNTVDFEGKTLALETSGQAECPFTLTPLKKSDYTINFGWTRADAAGNGFYEANIHLDEAKLQQAKINLDRQELKDLRNELEATAKAVYGRNAGAAKSNLKDLVVSVAKIAKNMQPSIPAYAAKATFDGLDENGNVQQKSVYSEYNIAANVMPTLSYNTLYGWQPSGLPGKDRILKFVDNLLNRVNIKINIDLFNGKKIGAVPNISRINIVSRDQITADVIEIVIDEDVPFVAQADGQTVHVHLDPSSIHVKDMEASVDEQVIDVYAVDDNGNVTSQKIGTATVPKQTATIDGQDVTIPEYNTDVEIKKVDVNGEAHVQITKYVDITDEVRKMYDHLANPIMQFNDQLDQLNDFMEDVGGLLDEINNVDKTIQTQVDNMLNDYKTLIHNRVYSYLDRIENALLSRAHYVNDAMQPLMLVQSGDNLKMASRLRNYPSRMPQTTANLILTSYNGEFLTPAYKKFVVATRAWKVNTDGSLTLDDAEAKAANQRNALLKVLPGATRSVKFEGKPGYKYEIIYEACDYHGKIAAPKQYIQF